MDRSHHALARSLSAISLASLTWTVALAASAQEAVSTAAGETSGWLDTGLGPLWSGLAVLLALVAVVGLAIIAWSRFSPNGWRSVMRRLES